MPLTQTEAWYLGESLRAEDLFVKKLTAYKKAARDPELRTLIDRLEGASRRNRSLLSSHVM